MTKCSVDDSLEFIGWKLLCTKKNWTKTEDVTSWHLKDHVKFNFCLSIFHFVGLFKWALPIIIIFPTAFEDSICWQLARCRTSEENLGDNEVNTGLLDPQCNCLASESSGYAGWSNLMVIFLVFFGIPDIIPDILEKAASEQCQLILFVLWWHTNVSSVSANSRVTNVSLFCVAFNLL